MKQKKRSALITGGAKGIGRSIAELLSKKNINIAIADIIPENEANEIIRICRKNKAEVYYIQADISSSSDRKKIINSVRSNFAELNILVNNAGIGPKERVDILKATEESYDHVMNVNLKGPYFLTQCIANWMIEQKKNDEKKDFIIINISSISSYTSSINRGEYCISKAGVSMMTKLYADRLSEFGIKVYEIRPGMILTDMTAKNKDKYDKLIKEGLLPLKKWGEPSDVSETVCALVNNYLPFSTGEVINIDGGFHLRRL